MTGWRETVRMARLAFEEAFPKGFARLLADGFHLVAIAESACPSCFDVYLIATFKHTTKNVGIQVYYAIPTPEISIGVFPLNNGKIPPILSSWGQGGVQIVDLESFVNYRFGNQVVPFPLSKNDGGRGSDRSSQLVKTDFARVLGGYESLLLEYGRELLDGDFSCAAAALAQMWREQRLKWNEIGVWNLGPIGLAAYALLFGDPQKQAARAADHRKKKAVNPIVKKSNTKTSRKAVTTTNKKSRKRSSRRKADEDKEA